MSDYDNVKLVFGLVLLFPLLLLVKYYYYYYYQEDEKEAPLFH